MPILVSNEDAYDLAPVLLQRKFPLVEWGMFHAAGNILAAGPWRAPAMHKDWRPLRRYPWHIVCCYGIDMHKVSPSAPAADDLDSERLILRDGTTATVRRSVPSDEAQIVSFFRELSPESRWHRFFAVAVPQPELLRRFADSENPRQAFTLLAFRTVAGNARIIAVASYVALTETAAEVAFAVDDRFQGKGISTLLLERLAVYAAEAGFLAFHASVLADNVAMRDVFRDSGFAMRSTSSQGVIELRLDLSLSIEGVASAEHRRQRAAAESIRPLLEPRSIAVIGASREASKIGSRVLRALQEAGFEGRIIAVHPIARELDGVPAVPSARDLPAGVDAAIVAVPAARVLDVVDDCAAAGVKALVVISAGFAETGPDGHRVAARADRARPRLRDAHDRSELHGASQHRSVGADECVVFAGLPAGWTIALSSQSGALGIAILRLARRAADRPVGLRERRQQSGCLEQRSARVLGIGSENARHHAVPRIVRQSAPLRAAGPPHRPSQAHRRVESGAFQGWIARRR